MRCLTKWGNGLELDPGRSVGDKADGSELEEIGAQGCLGRMDAEQGAPGKTWHTGSKSGSGGTVYQGCQGRSSLRPSSLINARRTTACAP